MKIRWIVIIATLVLLALACNVPGNLVPQAAQPTEASVPAQGDQSEPPTQPGNDTQQPAQDNQASPTEAPIPCEAPAAEPTAIPSEPVGVRAGLSSLNSYILTIGVTNSGPTDKDKSDVTVESKFSRDADTSLTTMKTVSSSADKPEENSSENYIYNIKNEQCSGSEDSWSFSTMTPAQKELVDVYKQMIDVTPLIGEPVLVGPENVNGVDTNHFSFKVKGLGVSSGAEVTANQGDYWLAVDGRYIVRYSLVLETRSGPNSDVMHQEVHIELTNINQPVPDVVFPQGCIEAKNKPKE
jgi:hypothetical protein